MYRKILPYTEMRFRDLGHFLLLLFIISLLLNTTCGAFNHDDYRLLVERRISVQRGLCAYIPCRFTVQQSNDPSARAIGIWYKDATHGEVVASQDSSQVPPNNPGRIFFTGDASKFDCSMSINDVQPSDGDKPYLFRLQDDTRSYNYLDDKIQLTVTDLTDKPEITPMKKLLAGTEVTLTCQSPGRCNGSPPLITWDGRVQGNIVTYHTVHPDGNRTYYSNITFTPSKEDNRSPLTCNVNFQASSITTLNQITLNVESSSSTDYKIIVGIVTGNLIILLLIALGVVWYLKRHMKKKLGNNHVFELGDARATESVYQDLQKPTTSIYDTITRSQQ